MMPLETGQPNRILLPSNGGVSPHTSLFSDRMEFEHVVKLAQLFHDSRTKTFLSLA